MRKKNSYKNRSNSLLRVELFQWIDGFFLSTNKINFIIDSISKSNLTIARKSGNIL